MPNPSILPGATIGIIGGGQLGKMLCTAAAELGYKTHVYCPADDSPAFDCSTRHTKSTYENAAELEVFARDVDLITFEFENIPVSTIQHLEQTHKVAPGSRTLYLSQNRLREKGFAESLDIATAPWREVHSAEELKRAVSDLGYPCVLKTTELGYDGKGQVKIDDESDLDAVWNLFGKDEGIVEAWIPFEREVSAIVARSANGEIRGFPVAENVHENGILSRTRVPSHASEAVQQLAQQTACQIAEALGVVGLLAVEYFVAEDGQLLFNEMAPRPHNSGHWTQDACRTSQFEQHIRAICGLPLGCVDVICDVEMHNLVGDDVECLNAYWTQPGAKIHWYDKQAAKAGRKMGHVNLTQIRTPALV